MRANRYGLYQRFNSTKEQRAPLERESEDKGIFLYLCTRRTKLINDGDVRVCLSVRFFNQRNY